ncbi:cytochrome P450 family protein, partial [Actinocorallia lasiicapitis]
MDGSEAPFDLSRFDPFGADRAAFHEVLASARTLQPVFFSEPLRAWCVTTYDDVVRVATDTVSFAPVTEPVPGAGLHPEAARVLALVRREPCAGPGGYDAWLAADVFSADRVRSCLPGLRATVAAYAERLPTDARFDLAAEFSDQVALAALLGFLGFPDDDFDLMAKAVHDLGELAERGGSLSTLEQWEKGSFLQGVVSHVAGLADQWREKTVREGADLAGAFADDRGFAAAALRLVGSDWPTTAGGLSNIVATLLGREGCWEEFVAGRFSARAAVAEGLRVASPVA